jgi:hypothetical protein
VLAPSPVKQAVRELARPLKNNTHAICNTLLSNPGGIKRKQAGSIPALAARHTALRRGAGRARAHTLSGWLALPLLTAGAHVTAQPCMRTRPPHMQQKQKAHRIIQCASGARRAAAADSAVGTRTHPPWLPCARRGCRLYTHVRRFETLQATSMTCAPTRVSWVPWVPWHAGQATQQFIARMSHPHPPTHPPTPRRSHVTEHACAERQSQQDPMAASKCTTHPWTQSGDTPAKPPAASQRRGRLGTSSQKPSK